MKRYNTGLPRCARNDEPSSFYHNSQAFTIVELLVVIIVIAILAVITIVSYTNITKQAHISSLASGLNSSMKALETYKEGTSSTETYPISLATMTNLKLDSAITWSYTTTSARNEYCLQGTIDGVTKSISSTNPNITNTPCGTLDGLVGWWKLNGNAKDSSGNNSNGTMYGGAVPAVGQDNASNHAYLFDGVDDYISFGDNDVLSFGGSASDSIFSLSIWVNSPAPSGVRGILSKASSPSAGEYYLIQNNDGYWYFRLVDNSSPAFIGVQFLFPASLYNSWHHVSITYDGSSLYTGINVYIDGSKVTTFSANNGSYVAMENTPLPVTIGKREYYYSGLIDDTRVYNRALSASEIQALYSQGAQ